MKYDREDLLGRAPIPTALLTLVAPTVLGQLTTMLYNLTDTYFVGQTGDPCQVAAVTLTYPVYHIINAITNMFGIGGGSHISRLLGQGKASRARNVCSFCFYGAAVLVALYSGILICCRDQILTVVGAATKETLEYSSDYVMWVAVIGGIPTMLGLMFAHLLQSEGRGAKAGLGMIIGGVCNIILDPIFIKLLDNGALGAAVATLISTVVSAIYYIAVVISTRDNTYLSFKVSDIAIDRETCRSVFVVGIPAALYVIMAVCANMVYNNLLAGANDAAVAAGGITKKLDMLPMNLSMGLNQGIIPLLAFNYAAGNYTRMKQVLRTALLLGISSSLLCVVIYCWKAPELIALFISDPETIVYGSTFLRLAVVAIPLMAANLMINSLFQACGKGRQSAILSVSRQGLLAIPLMYFLHFFWDTYGVISAQVVADSLTLIISLVFYMRLNKTLFDPR